MYLLRKKEKILVPILCALGIAAVGYGMARENNPVFIVGLVFVIAGYLRIRWKLRASLKEKQGREPGP